MTQKEIEVALSPYVEDVVSIPEKLYLQLSKYLELLLKWNERTNLTAIRSPEEIVRRHFGESLYATQHIGDCEILLDFGSGAGFPGLPIQLLLPNLQVTLAESQNKKAAFLREALRTLGLKTEIWSARVETMPANRLFDVVTLRAVDNMDAALKAAAVRARRKLLLLTTATQTHTIPEGFEVHVDIPLPERSKSHILSLRRRSEFES